MKLNKLICPYCENSKIHKHGKKNNIQRYKCTNTQCNKTFSENHTSPLRYAKKFKNLWLKYYELMEAGCTIRQCAALLSINIVTSFFWRHRILNSYTTSNEVNHLNGTVELTKLIIHENFKGSRVIPAGRRARINVVSAVSNTYDVASIPVSRSSFSYKNLIDLVYPKIDKNAYLTSYYDTRLAALSRNHNCKINKKLLHTINNKPLYPFYSIKFKQWIFKFHGIATKYLENYLNWYIKIFKNTLAPNIDNTPIIESYIKWKDIKSSELIINDFFDRSLFKH